MVARVLLVTPSQNASPTVNLPAGTPFRASFHALSRSKTPYVIAGLAVKTRPGFKPVQRPVIPLSAMISCAVSSNEGAPARRDFEAGDPSALEEDGSTHSCCRVAMTATGMVKI